MGDYQWHTPAVPGFGVGRENHPFHSRLDDGPARAYAEDGPMDITTVSGVNKFLPGYTFSDTQGRMQPGVRNHLSGNTWHHWNGGGHTDGKGPLDFQGLWGDVPRSGFPGSHPNAFLNPLFMADKPASNLVDFNVPAGPHNPTPLSHAHIPQSLQNAEGDVAPGNANPIANSKLALSGSSTKPLSGSTTRLPSESTTRLPSGSPTVLPDTGEDDTIIDTLEDISRVLEGSGEMDSWGADPFTPNLNDGQRSGQSAPGSSIHGPHMPGDANSPGDHPLMPGPVPEDSPVRSRTASPMQSPPSVMSGESSVVSNDVVGGVNRPEYIIWEEYELCKYYRDIVDGKKAFVDETDEDVFWATVKTYDGLEDIMHQMRTETKKLLLTQSGRRQKRMHDRREQQASGTTSPGKTDIKTAVENSTNRIQNAIGTYRRINGQNTRTPSEQIKKLTKITEQLHKFLVPNKHLTKQHREDIRQLIDQERKIIQVMNANLPNEIRSRSRSTSMSRSPY